MRSPIALFGLASLFAAVGAWAYVADSWLAYGVLAGVVVGGGAYTVRRAKALVRAGNEGFAGDLPPHVRRALTSGERRQG